MFSLELYIVLLQYTNVSIWDTTELPIKNDGKI
jgi:hypothetical protein